MNCCTRVSQLVPCYSMDNDSTDVDGKLPHTPAHPKLKQAKKVTARHIHMGSTAWNSEIGTLTSLGACYSGTASSACIHVGARA